MLPLKFKFQSGRTISCYPNSSRLVLRPHVEVGVKIEFRCGAHFSSENFQLDVLTSLLNPKFGFGGQHIFFECMGLNPIVDPLSGQLAHSIFRLVQHYRSSSSHALCCSYRTKSLVAERSHLDPPNSQVVVNICIEETWLS